MHVYEEAANSGGPDSSFSLQEGWGLPSQEKNITDLK